MKRITMRLIPILCTLVLLLSLLPASAVVSAAADSYVLPVFETSDIHGYLVDSAYSDAAQYQYRLAYIADKVDDVRDGDSSRTLLLDGGDIYQGNVLSNLQNGEPIVAAFDAMQYDAVSLGNHEFDWGITNTTDSDGTMPRYNFEGVAYDSQIPIVCSNIYYDGTNTRVNFTKDYVILNKTAVNSDGDEIEVKIAVIGYVNDYSSSIMTSEIAPYDIKNELYKVENTAKALKEQNLADAVILLTHEDASEMGGQISKNTEIDLICGGHSHYGQVGIGNAPYIQAASQATAYAYAELRFDGAGNVTVGGAQHVWINDQPNRLHDTAANKNELAADVLEISHAALENVVDELNYELGYITTPVTSYAIGNNSMSTTAGNWMTDLANRATGAKVSFTNSGGIRTSFYLTNGKRTITKGDIYTIAPFNNQLYVYDVNYAKLLEILNYSINRGKGLGLRMSGIDCYYSGTSVTALVVDGECIYKNGTWRNGANNQTVRISANEFIATSSGTPFYSLNGTSSFVTSAYVDNESFIRVLEEEGKANGGFLFVDSQPHMVEGSYDGDVPVYYNISTSYTGRGTVTESTQVLKGSNFTVTITPDEGHMISSVKVDGVDVGALRSYTFYNVTYHHTLQAIFEPIQEPHVHSYIRGTTEPTCDEQGYTTYTCSCGDSYVGDYVDALGHEYDNGFCIRCAQKDPDYVPVEPPEETIEFIDVPENAWYASAVDYAIANGLMNGMGENRFEPETQMSRAMLVTVLWRYEGEPQEGSNSFVDVTNGAWYIEAVAWAAHNGIVGGVGNNRFDPDGMITREQLAAILYRYCASLGIDTREKADLNSFPDGESISAYARDALAWAVAEGLVTGTKIGGKIYLDPQGSATRAQVATVLMRFIENVLKYNIGSI